MMIKYLLFCRAAKVTVASIFALFLILAQNNAYSQGPIPDAVDDQLTTDEDIAATIDVCSNDFLSNDAPNTWSLIGTNGGALHGTVVATGCNFYYNPESNFNGPDTFYYRICDNNNDCDTAMVIVVVNSIDDEPVAVGENFNTDEDILLNGDLSPNDTPSGDGGNIYSAVGANAGAGHGTVVIAGDGSFYYMPDDDFNGSDEFYYQFCDIDGDCSTATASITIAPTNDVPVPVEDFPITDEETPINIEICANDSISPDGGNTWTLSGTDGGALHGTVVPIDECNYTYTPELDFNGLDSFYYTICDAENDCATGKVIVLVNQVDDYPEAFDDNGVTDENVPVQIDVCVNDVLSGDGGNTWELVGVNGNAINGTVTQVDPCTFEYTPNPSYEGTDFFIYQVCDADGDCSIATVLLQINSVNDLPDAIDDDFLTYEEIGLVDNVSLNDYQSTDGGIYYSVSTDPTHGIVLMNVDGSFVYFPEDRFVGQDTFYYSVCDIDQDCDVAMAVITVDPPQLSECRWCNKSTATSIVNSIYGDGCTIPDIIVDVRLAHLPVDTYKILNGHPATGSLQAAIDYVNLHGDPSPGDGQIFIGVIASDCLDVQLCGDPESRNAASSSSYGLENVIINNQNAEQLNIIGCNAYLRPAVSSLPVIKIQNGVGPVRVSYLGVQNSLAEGFLVKNNSSNVIISHCRALNNNVGVRVQDDDVLVTSMLDVSNNNIGISLEGAGSNTVTLCAIVKENAEAGIKISSSYNTCSKNTVGSSGNENGIGIQVLGTNNSISENITSYNNSDGIRVSSMFNNLYKNTSNRNGGHGINADQAIGASGVTCSYNKANYNDLEGIRACGQIDNGNNTGVYNLGYPQIVFVCVPSSVSISTGNTYVCAGSSVTFTANALNIGPSPVYQWKRNGSIVGTSSATYTASSVNNGDQIYCIASASVSCCIIGTNATSNTIVMSVYQPTVASVSISANPGTTVCTGTSVTFTATPVNGGSTPFYQWKKNGSNIGTNSPTYTYSSFTNGNTISCVMTSSETCISGNPATSATLTMNILSKVTPSITIATNQSTSNCSGTTVTFYATPSFGGSSPSFQWKKNGVNVGTNSSTFIISSLINNDKISCALTSNYPCLNSTTASSNIITMSVSTLLTPSVSINSSINGTISANTSVTFTATPVNGGTPVYQWMKNSVFVGSNSNTYTNSSWINGDQVQVVMTSSVACPSINPVSSNVIGISVGSAAAERYLTVDISADKAFRYDANFNLVSSQSLSNANADANDVCYAGSIYYTLDKSDKTVYRCGSSVIVSKILKDITGSSLNNPVGLSISGDDIWVTDAGKKFIYKYSLTAAFSSSTGNINALLQIPFNSLNGTGASGMFMDASYLYVLDNTKKQFFRYLKASPYTSTASRVIRDNGGNALQTATGSTLEGSIVWVVDNGKDQVFQYDLSTLFFGTGTIYSGAQYPLNSANANATGIAVIGSFAKPLEPAPVAVKAKGVVQAFPNPYDETINFRITPTQTGKASLELFDFTGRKLMQVFEGELEKGRVADIMQYIPELIRQPMFYKFRQGDAAAQGMLMPAIKK